MTVRDVPKIITSRFDQADAHTLAGYRRTEGYAGLEAALKKHGKPHEFHRYKGVNHAFMNREGKNWHPQAAKASMELAIAFLRKHTAPK